MAIFLAISRESGISPTRHAIFPGGCAVLAATLVDEVEGAEWQDLGMPETLWINRVGS